MSIVQQPLGLNLQIVFSEGVRKQMNEDFSDFDFVQACRIDDPKGRELRFALQNSLLPQNVRYRGAGDLNYAKGEILNLDEYTAEFTELVSTLRLKQNVYERAILSRDAKYVDDFAQSLETLAISQKKRFAADLYLDGSGVLAQAAANADDTNISAAGTVVISISTATNARGHVGAVEQNDLLEAVSTTGSKRTPSGGAPTSTPVAWRVVKVDRANDEVTLRAVNAQGQTVTGATASNIVASDVLYQHDTYTTFPDLTSGSLDYGKLKAMPGLASLAANDGRTVHTMKMEGVLAGSQYDAKGDVIGLRHLQASLTDAKTRAGHDAFSWDKMITAPEVFDEFIDVNEADRRIVSLNEATRGGANFVYIHGKDRVELRESIYCPKNRIWMPPSCKGEGRIIETHLSDFKPVRAKDGDPFHPDVGPNGYIREMVGFMDAYGTNICKMPAAVASIANFKLSAR